MIHIKLPGTMVQSADIMEDVAQQHTISRESGNCLNQTHRNHFLCFLSCPNLPLLHISALFPLFSKSPLVLSLKLPTFLILHFILWIETDYFLFFSIPSSSPSFFLPVSLPLSSSYLWQKR